MAAAVRAQYISISASMPDPKDQLEAEPVNNIIIRDDRPYLIQEGLWLGSMLAEQHPSHLKAKGVTHVLQVAEGLRQTHPGEFEYLQVSRPEPRRACTGRRGPGAAPPPPGRRLLSGRTSTSCTAAG
jgi:hypothetical protein